VIPVSVSQMCARTRRTWMESARLISQFPKLSTPRARQRVNYVAACPRRLCCQPQLQHTTLTPHLRKQQPPQVQPWRPRCCAEPAPAVAIVMSLKYRHSKCSKLSCGMTIPLHHVSIFMGRREACCALNCVTSCVAHPSYNCV
jgi:hypothetical protein